MSLSDSRLLEILLYARDSGDKQPDLTAQQLVKIIEEQLVVTEGILDKYSFVKR